MRAWIPWLLLSLACAQGGGTSGKPDAGFDANIDPGEVGPRDGGADVVEVQLDAELPDAPDVPFDGGAMDAELPDAELPDAGPMDGGVDTGPVDRCLGVDCSSMDGPCVIGTCDPGSGSCTTAPRMDGTSCDTDPMDCLVATCTAGACGSAPVAECTACATGVCSATGTCGPEPTTRVLEDFERGVFAAGWTVGGSSGWTLTSGERFTGTWSARSGSIGASQTSTLTTTVTAPVATGLGFHTRTSSENNYDWLEFRIDGALVGRWSGDTAWTERIYSLSAGAHTLEWRYLKDGSTNSGLDTVWIDDVRFRPAIAAEGSFESSLAPFTSSSPAWTRVTTSPRSGSYAARGADISDGQSTSMSTSFTLSAAYDISFWYRVSSEEGFDYFRAFLDGAQVVEASGTVGWTRFTRNVAPGDHTLRFEYRKDTSLSRGDDNGFVDDVDLGWPAPSSGLCP